MTIELNRNDEYVKYWHDKACNIIPLQYKEKKPDLVSLSEFLTKKYTGNFKPENNIGLVLGVTSSNVIGIDIDTEKLSDYAINKYKDQTLINKSFRGCHLIFRLDGKLEKNLSLTNENKEHCDVKINGYLAVFPSVHPSGITYSKVSKTDTIKKITFEELMQILNDLGFEMTDGLKLVKELHDINYKQTEGTNRSEVLLRIVDSWKIKNPEFTQDMLLPLALEYNNKHFVPPYPENKVRAIVKQGYDFAKIIQEETQKKTSTYANEIQKKIRFVTTKDKSEQILFHRCSVAHH